jgi:hypothetical protein
MLLSRWLHWRSVLTAVQPDTLIRWHRQGWRLFWRWKSRSGRPPIPADLRRLIVSIARANPTWGEERITNERLLKLGLVVSPRTVGRYLRRLRPSGGGRHSQRWAAFVRNHAQALLACDFLLDRPRAGHAGCRHASAPLDCSRAGIRVRFCHHRPCERCRRRRCGGTLATRRPDPRARQI